MKKVFFLLSLLFVNIVYAETQDGAVTNNLMGMFKTLGTMFANVCLVIGIALVVASFIQYRQHRLNKLLVPISKPIFLLILGLFLSAIPILGKYTQGGQLIMQQEVSE